MRQPGKRFEQGQYAFQVSRECLTHLILLPRDSTEIRLQGQETKEGSKFFMCIFWLTLKTKFLMFFFSVCNCVSNLVNKCLAFYSDRKYLLR